MSSKKVTDVYVLNTLEGELLKPFENSLDHNLLASQKQQYIYLSYDTATGSEILPCIKPKAQAS